MSRICQGCGGVLGRDCFNEQECIQISQSNRQYDEQEITHLRQENEYLKSLLIETIYRAQFMLPTNDVDLQRFDDGADVTKSDYIERIYAFIGNAKPAEDETSQS